MDHVDPVGQQVGQHTPAEVLEVPPALEALGVEGLIAGRTQPPFPVEPGHVDLGGRLQALELIPVRLDERHLAELARIHDLLAEDPVVPAPLLGAGLHHLLRGLDGRDHGRALVDGVRDGLLDVDVLAGGDGLERHRLVPVIGSADEDRVYVLVVEHAAVVGDLRRLAPGDLHRLQHPGLVDVGDRDHLLARQRPELLHEVARAAAGADHADADAVVRAEGGRRRRVPPGQEGGGGTDGGSQEAAPPGMDLVGHALAPSSGHIRGMARQMVTKAMT